MVEAGYRYRAWERPQEQAQGCGERSGQGQPYQSMAKDIDLLFAYFVTVARRRPRTSVGQSLALAVRLAHTLPPSGGPPPRTRDPTRRLTPWAPRTQDHKTKPGDWDSYPLVYI